MATETTTGRRREAEMLVDDASGSVSAKAFTDPDVYERELDRVYRRSWVFVAHESEIPKEGDFVTRRIGADPVVVIRGRDGVVRVLLNACRHRGRIVCSEDVGNANHFQCSYHGWTYANTGELKGVPFLDQYGDRLERAEHGLVAAPLVDSYHGLVFACWDPAQEPLIEYLDSVAWMLDLVVGRSGGMEVAGPPLRWVADFNWKLGAGNFAGDTHHLPITHGFVGHLGHESTRSAGAAEYYTFVGRNGHSAAAVTNPEGAHPTYMELPEDVIGRLEGNLSDHQRQFFSRTQSIVGTVFPNLSYLSTSAHDPHEWGGAEGDRLSFITIRQWQPRGPDQTETMSWVLVDACAPEWWKVLSQRIVEREFGLAGLFEQDDTENWAEVNRGLRGPVARDLWLSYGLAIDDKPIEDWPGPGSAFRHNGSLGEGNERVFYAHWNELMSRR